MPIPLPPEPSSAAPPPAGRTLRAYLARLLLLVLAPPVLLAIYFAAQNVAEAQRDRDREARTLAEALTANIDRVVLSRQRGLALLAEMPGAAEPERRPEFRALADSFVATYGAHVVLVAPDGRMLMNTRVPEGNALPSILRGLGRSAPVQALATAKPAVSDVHLGPLAGRRMVDIAVPVQRQGRIVAALVATQEIEAFGPLLHLGTLPAGWAISLRDGTGQVIAGTPGAAGQGGSTPYWFAAPSEFTGWSAYVEVPPSVATARLREVAKVVGGLVLLAGAAGLLGGVIAARRLGLAVAGLAGGGLPAGAARVRELEQARQRLEAGTRERAEALAVAVRARNVLRQTLARINDGFAAVDREWRLTFVNPAAAQIVGHDDPVPMLGRVVWDVVPEMRNHPWIEAAERALASGEPQQVETYSTRRQAWFEARIFPAPEGLSIYFGDITARRRAEDLLRASELRYRLLFEANPAPMWVYDLDTLRFLDVNEAAVRHYGYSREEFLALTLADIRPPEDVPRLREIIAGGHESAARAVRQAGTFRHRTKDGRLIDVQITFSTVDFEGRRACLVNAVDVTERLAAERQRAAALHAVAEAHQRLSEVMTRVTEGFIAVDRDGRYTYANQRAAELMGLAGPEALVGHALADLGPDGADGPFARAVREALRTLRPHAQDAYFAPSGRWFDVRLFPAADGVTIYLADITEARAAHLALQRSELRYRHLFDLNPTPLGVWDVQTLRFLAVNEAAIRRYGYSREEFLALTVNDLNTPEEAARLDALLHEQRAESYPGSASPSLWRHRIRDGSIIDVEIVERVIDYDGRRALLTAAVDVTERRRAQAALRERDERLRLFVEHAPVALAMFDGDMRYVVASRRWRCDYHLGDIELAGRSHYEVFPEVPEAWRAIHRRGLAGEVVRADAEAFERADGSVQWLRWEVRPWSAPGGGVGGILLYTEDITERVAGEQALRDSERDYRILAEQMPAIVYRAANDRGGARYVSPHIVSLGYTPEEWRSQQGPNWHTTLHPDDRPRAMALLATLSDAGQELTLEYRLRDREGRWRDFIDHLRVAESGPGRELAFQGVMVEITPLKRSEQALREAEAYQRSLFEAIGDGVLLLDRALAVLDANPSALDLLGYARDELLGLRLQDLVLERDRARVDDALAELLAAGDGDGAARLAEWEQRKRDGSSFPAEVSARAAGQGRFVAVLRDVSERRNSQRALMAYQMELSELTQRLLTQERETTRHVAQTLHDQLGQSLAVARLRLDAATTRMGPAMPAPLHDECDRIGGALDRAIADVRVVLGELRPPMLEEQGLIAALDNEIRMRTLDAGSVDVLLEVDDGRLAARWPAEVEYAAFMIAREAIVNAQRHAEATLVRVIVDGEGDSLLLEVEDDGRGIPEELRGGRPGHLGLVGMRERAIAIGAHFAVEQPVGGGTRVALRWGTQPSSPGSLGSL